mmetsp:Transcript_58465/g.189379  ORF Transcript_58465/g.189379 Transcript_58465/m.189379 type:complete len:258 (-) Transcript_58465:118-891(-)
MSPGASKSRCSSRNAIILEWLAALLSLPPPPQPSERMGTMPVDDGQDTFLGCIGLPSQPGVASWAEDSEEKAETSPRFTFCGSWRRSVGKEMSAIQCGSSPGACAFGVAEPTLRIIVFFCFLRTLISCSGHKWQCPHSMPFWQLPGRQNQQQGWQLPEVCRTEPRLGTSAGSGMPGGRATSSPVQLRTENVLVLVGVPSASSESGRAAGAAGISGCSDVFATAASASFCTTAPECNMRPLFWTAPANAGASSGSWTP